MAKDSLSLQEDYWDTFTFEPQDLEFIYNHLIECETPQTSQELIDAIIGNRIFREKALLGKKQAEIGAIYYPKNSFKMGDRLLFPSHNWQKGRVVSIRPGNNPDMAPFEIITVEFNEHGHKQFAASLENHILNKPVDLNFDDPLLDPKFIQKKYGPKLIALLNSSLEANSDLVRIAGRWFPRTLLVDVNIGFLNLAEALLDMNNGGPLTTSAILGQIDLPTDANRKLSEFSLNLALQEDERFDEVGPSGEVIWYLHRLEPKEVQDIPVQLKYKPIEYNPASVTEMVKLFDTHVIDENENDPREYIQSDDVSISLIYPHWQAGTLPLSGSIAALFPTAYESPRIRFTFVENETGNKFPGWVIREHRYVYGLQNWYKSQGVIPGSLIHVKRGKEPGEVIIQSEKRRPTRDWVRTILVGADGGVVFAMVKQLVSTIYDERMAVYIPDPEAVETLWTSSGKGRQTIEQIVISTMKEIAKLNPQGHVHGQELYAALNVIRRCPPGPILAKLLETKKAAYLGNLYFRLEDSQE
jgi:hypothetical protein